MRSKKEEAKKMKDLFITKKHIGLSILFVSLFIFSSCTKPESVPRTISVSGSATVYAEPDEATISFSLYTKEQNLAAAKEKNDALLANAHKVFSTYAIVPKDIRLDHVNIRPDYRYDRDGVRIFLGYAVEQNISVTLKALKNYEALLTDILKVGVDRINNVSFSVQDSRKYKDEARINAIQTAEEKAELFCSAPKNNGVKLSLGKVLSINETASNMYSSGISNVYSQRQVLYKTEEGADASAGGITPMGQIPIRAEVFVTFELK
ncbi:DUF541 domain-containing protein [Treponema phagedenis]|uniref:DUF541 domain-containing protein n=2 Tax=Treponema phagedenis TaxID=162 RepID=A0AAE6ISZ7_TREPH|nr:DUF541 domain-containing protein [Treponema phagedenis]QEJ97656.1 DUF541 domain-containing protein [Treponema phagedenis]QEK00624.1 DUF541 domain-containing protein [Treponema phagedenis]QEK03225.1 DUF541 domain-containing protein [Treponema phagedenis]QEK05634.1 DUF541 domain-containing protein [Treponema phagedenis]